VVPSETPDIERKGIPENKITGIWNAVTDAGIIIAVAETDRGRGRESIGKNEVIDIGIRGTEVEAQIGGVIARGNPEEQEEQALRERRAEKEGIAVKGDGGSEARMADKRKEDEEIDIDMPRRNGLGTDSNRALRWRFTVTRHTGHEIENYKRGVTGYAGVVLEYCETSYYTNLILFAIDFYHDSMCGLWLAD
jgi:hypothetical protein